MKTLLEKRDGTCISVTHSDANDLNTIVVENRYIVRLTHDYGLTFTSARKLYARMLATSAISETIFDHVHTLLTGTERPAEVEVEEDENEYDYLLLSDTGTEREAADHGDA